MAETISRRMPLAGGRVETDDRRVAIDVPAGAFLQELNVTVTDVLRSERIVLGGEWIKPARRVLIEARLPAGVPFTGRFPVPVGLTFRLTPYDLAGGSIDGVAIYGRENAGDPWQAVPTTVDRQRLLATAWLEHFSEWFVGVTQQETLIPTMDSYEAEMLSGSAVLSVPIRVPPGTNGLQPTLNLSYSSAAATGVLSEDINTYDRAQASWVGFGWNLDLGYIEMEQSEGVQNRGKLVLNGRSHEIIKVSADPHTYKTQEEAFLRIHEVDENVGGANYRYYRVHDRGGTEYRFGYESRDAVPGGLPGDHYRANGSRMDQVTGSQVPYTHRMIRFHLDRVTDTHGNTMEIRYLADQAADSERRWDRWVYPTEILYTGRAAGRPGDGTYRRRVLFDLSDPATEPRPDPPPLPLMHHEVRRLKAIRTEVSDDGTTWRPVRTYTLGHGTLDYSGAGGGRPFLVLTSVTESAPNETPLPATTFAYDRFEGWTDDPGQPGDARRCPLPLLTSSANGYGGVVTYAYTPYNWRDHSTEAPHRIRQWVVLSKSVQDGVERLAANPAVTTFERSAPAWTTKFGNGLYPIFRGFEWSEAVEPTGHRRRHVFYRGLGSWVDTNDPEQLKGKEREVIHMEADRTEIGREQSFYVHSAPHQLPSSDQRDWNVYHVFMSERRTRRGAVANRTVYGYDATFQGGGQYGNQTDVVEYRNENDATWTRRTRRWFYPYDNVNGAYVVDRVAQEDVYGYGDPSWVLERKTLYLYDNSTSANHSLGTADDVSFRGRLTGLRRLATLTPSEQWTDATYGYDEYGNRSSETTYGGYGTASTLATADPRSTTTTYDAYHSFAASTTNALSHVEQRTYEVATGKPKTVTDPNGHVTTLTYDGYGRLRRAVGPTVGAYAKETKTDYPLPSTANGRTTTPVTIERRTDADGTVGWHTVRRFHDGLGRLVQEQSDAVGGHEVSNRRWDGRGLLLAESTPHLVTGLAGAFAGDDWAADAAPKTEYAYDALKRERTRTLPRRSGQPAVTVEREYADFTTRVVDQNRHVKDEVRDGLGRLVQVVEYEGVFGAQTPYATTAYEYRAVDDLKRVIDAAGNQTTLEHDLLGRKIGMVDPDMGAWSYAYDGRGNMSSQTDARNTQLTFAYDGLNRLLTKSGPRSWSGGGGGVAPGSPIRVSDVTDLRAAVAAHYQSRGMTLPPWTDPTIAAEETPIRAVHFNELKDRISDLRVAAGMGALPSPTGDWPLDQTKRIRAQHQVDLRTWLAEYEGAGGGGGTVGTLATYAYDEGGAAANALGRRTSLSDLSGWTRWGYDPYGRVTQMTKSIDGAQYVTDYGYDALDRVRAMTYPEDGGVRETLFYAYGPDTRPVRAWSSLGPDYLTSALYNPLGQPTSLSLNGGAATETRAYFGVDPSYPAGPFGALRSVRLQAGSSPVLVDRVHAWDAAGNLTQLVDAANGNETTTYTYDHLDRLLSASGAVTETYAFDHAVLPSAKTGNPSHRNGLRYFYDDPAHKHAVTAYDGGTDGYAYDANGNLTGRGTTGFEYDAENRLSRMTGGGAATFAYDGDGARVKRADQYGTVHYAGRHFEKAVGGPGTRYYSCTLGKTERLLAFRRGGTLRWVGQDHLGSTVRVADQGWAPVDQNRYLPFGQDRDPAANLATDQKFTGQVQDASTGLYWYRSRYYDPALTRFAQPDTIVPNFAEPQSLNRYSYVLNNPLKLVDPSGHVYEDYPGQLDAAEYERRPAVNNQPEWTLPPPPVENPVGWSEVAGNVRRGLEPDANDGLSGLGTAQAAFWSGLAEIEAKGGATESAEGLRGIARVSSIGNAFYDTQSTFVEEYAGGQRSIGRAVIVAAVSTAASEVGGRVGFARAAPAGAWLGARAGSPFGPRGQLIGAGIGTVVAGSGGAVTGAHVASKSAEAALRSTFDQLGFY